MTHLDKLFGGWVGGQVPISLNLQHTTTNSNHPGLRPFSLLTVVHQLRCLNCLCHCGASRVVLDVLDGSKQAFYSILLHALGLKDSLRLHRPTSCSQDQVCTEIPWNAEGIMLQQETCIE